jgi:hypothetical protein
MDESIERTVARNQTLEDRLAPNVMLGFHVNF